MANIDIHNSFRELRNGKKIPIRRKEPDLKKRKKVEQEVQISDEVEEINEDSDNLNEEPEEKDESENDDEESDNNDYNKGYYADVTDELNKMKNDLSFEKSSDVQNINLRKLDTKPPSGNCAKYTIWISILIAIVGILAVCLNSGLMANRDRDNQSDKLVLWKKAFTNLLDKYGDALPEISQKVINKSVQSVLKRQVPSEKFNNCEPAVILLIGSKYNMQAGNSHIGAKVDSESFRLSSHAAKAFLAQRWKEAISSNHVKLVVSPDSEPPGCQRDQDCELAACQSSNTDRCGILANTENRLPATSGVAKSKPKPRMKPEKGIKIKYIPKLKAAT